MRLSTLATLLILLLSSPDASSQSRADRRISTDDRGYRTHPGMLAKVADSANGNAFAVWGSTTFDSAGAVVLTVYAQQARRNTTVGRLHRLGADDSRLSHEIQTIAMGSNFIALYKDYPRTRKSGTYIQFYDAAADTLGPPNWMSSKGISAVPDPSRGRNPDPYRGRQTFCCLMWTSGMASFLAGRGFLQERRAFRSD